MERERGKQRCAFNSLAHLRHAFRIFFSEQVPAETRLSALGIFKLDDFYALDRLFAHPEKTGRDLGYYMILVRYQVVRETTFTGAGKSIPERRVMCLGNHRRQADRSEGHSTTVDRG